MAALCWMAVTLGLLLAVGNSSANFERPDQNQLTYIVDELWERYRPVYKVNNGQRRPMFSVAVSIPYDNNKNMYDISKVTDSPDKVKKSILSCEVYRGTRVVAATVLRWPNVLDQCPDEEVQWPDVLSKCRRSSMTWAEVKTTCRLAVKEGRADHAEYRVLEKFDTLTTNLNKNDFLLFYVLASPCDQRCTSLKSDWNILKSINEIKKWNNYAVVFSEVFKPRGGQPVPEEKLRGALEQLGSYQGPLGPIGLKNIFRCDGSEPCTSCSSGNKVTPFCYTDDPQPGPSHNLPSSSFILPQRDRSGSPSRSGQDERDQKNNNINTRAGVSTSVGGNPGGVVGQGDRGGGKGKKIDEGEGGFEVHNTDVDSNTGGGQVSSGLGVDSSGGGGGKGRRRRRRGKKGKKTNEGEGVSTSQSGLEFPNTDVDSNTGGGQVGSGLGVDSSGGGGGKGRRRRRRGKKGKKTNEGEGVSSTQSGLEFPNTDVDSNTGGGQVGSGLSVDSSGGGKGRHRRRRGKKGKKTNEGEGGFEVRNTDVDSNAGGGLGGIGRGKARKVGGRRVVEKRHRGANKQKSNQAQRKKKRQSRGQTQWNQEVQGMAEKQREKRQESKKGEKQRGGKGRNINQPQKRGKKQKRG